MQRTPPGSPSTSPIPGSSKGKGTEKGASNRNQDPPPHDETVCDSEDEGEQIRQILSGRNQDLLERRFSGLWKS